MGSRGDFIDDKYRPAKVAMQGPPESDYSFDEDDDFVPEGLKNFLAEAEKNLLQHKEDVLNFDSVVQPCVPKAVPNPNAVLSDDEDDEAFFAQILENERDEQLKSDLLSSLKSHSNPQFLSPEPDVDLTESMEQDFLSPSMNDVTHNFNPAADLTESQAKRMAMEGATPQSTIASHKRGVRNLQPELEQENQSIEVWVQPKQAKGLSKGNAQSKTGVTSKESRQSKAAESTPSSCSSDSIAEASHLSYSSSGTSDPIERERKSAGYHRMDPIVEGSSPSFQPSPSMEMRHSLR